jgi:hypothetical protein
VALSPSYLGVILDWRNIAITLIDPLRKGFECNRLFATVTYSPSLYNPYAMRSRIMYVESKAEGLNGPARIGRVTFNRTGRTLSYKGKSFQSLKGSGFKANYYETETGEKYWISGPRRDGLDRLYEKSALVVEIDADVREEYWTEIRKQPEQKSKSHT